MEVLYACCCGIDVHAKMLVACVLKAGEERSAHLRDDDGGLAAPARLADPGGVHARGD